MKCLILPLLAILSLAVTVVTICGIGLSALLTRSDRRANPFSQIPKTPRRIRPLWFVGGLAIGWAIGFLYSIARL